MQVRQPQLANVALSAVARSALGNVGGAEARVGASALAQRDGALAPLLAMLEDALKARAPSARARGAYGVRGAGRR